MNCPECHDLFQRQLDGVAGPEPAALETHLAACEVCRDRHSGVQRLAEGLRLGGRPVPPAGLSRRIVARGLAQRPARIRFRRSVRLTVAVAAGLLLSVFAGYQGQRLGLLKGPAKRPQLAEGPGRRVPLKKTSPGDTTSPDAAPSLGQTFA